MITHYFTLQALSKELHSILQGAKINEVFTQRKNELLISFDDLVHSKEFVAGGTLYISVAPELNYIFLRDRALRARKNSVDLFKNIIGSTVKELSILPFDRILILEFNCGKRLLLQIYNTAASNVILVDEMNAIIEAFKNNKDLESKPYTKGDQHLDRMILENSELFERAIIDRGSIHIFTALKQTVPMLGSLYAHEVLYRANVCESSMVGSINMDDVIRIYKETQNIFQEASHPQPAIYLQEGKKKIFSIIRLQHLAPYKTGTYSNTSEAIKNFIVKKFSEARNESHKDILLEKVTGELKKLRRTMEKTEQYSSDESEKYEHIGRLLLANLNNIKKGMKQIDLHNFADELSAVQITLDPAITPVENAKRYFEKAKKSKVAHQESLLRLKELSEKINILVKLETAINRVQTYDGMKEFIREYEHELKSMKLIKDKQANERPPFRIFSVAGGFEVWVGKSSANNDLLTMKYAKPNDLWFHARGASGSHTVLKVKGNTKEVPREAIRQAASIAAYYSKMRKASMVPVAYCERKYVRKQKNSATGTVFLEREEVIFVKPYLLGNP